LSHPGRFDPKFSLAAVFLREVLREVVDLLKARKREEDGSSFGRLGEVPPVWRRRQNA
jgi:hypothetical protein